MEDTRLLLEKIVAALAEELDEVYSVPPSLSTEKYQKISEERKYLLEGEALLFKSRNLVVLGGFTRQCISMLYGDSINETEKENLYFGILSQHEHLSK